MKNRIRSARSPPFGYVWSIHSTVRTAACTPFLVFQSASRWNSLESACEVTITYSTALPSVVGRKLGWDAPPRRAPPPPPEPPAPSRRGAHRRDAHPGRDLPPRREAGQIRCPGRRRRG